MYKRKKILLERVPARDGNKYPQSGDMPLGHQSCLEICLPSPSPSWVPIPYGDSNSREYMWVHAKKQKKREKLYKKISNLNKIITNMHNPL